MTNYKHNHTSAPLPAEGVLRKVSTQHLFSSNNIYSKKLTEHPELHLFKQEIENERHGPKFKPYTSTKKRVLFYRAIFFCIGVLYLILGLVLFYKTLSWSCSLIFGSYFLIKSFLCSFCAISAAASLLVALLIKTEKEAVKRLLRLSKHRLGEIYDRKMVKFGVQRFFSFGKEHRKSLSFKQIYHDSLENLQECKENTLHILDCIEKSGTLNSQMREELYNQAILELKERIELVIKTYNSSQPPRCLQTF